MSSIDVKLGGTLLSGTVGLLSILSLLGGTEKVLWGGSGRVLTPFHPERPNGPERGYSWSCVPFLDKIPCLGPCPMLGLASQISTNGIFCTCHGTKTACSSAIYVHLHLIAVRLHLPMPSLCPFGRAVRCSQTRKRVYNRTFFFLFQKSRIHKERRESIRSFAVINIT